MGDNGGIVHYDGATWRAIASPTYADLTAIQIVAPDAMWAVGSQRRTWNGFTPPLDSAVILYYDGHEWRVDGYLPYDRLTTLVMAEATRGYLFGDDLLLTLAGAPGRDQGALRGHVTAEDGSALAGITVHAYRDVTPTPSTVTPVFITMAPETGDSGSYSPGEGAYLTVQAPPNAVTETVTLRLQAITPRSAPVGFAFGGQGFTLAVALDNTVQANYRFQKPITVTIDYTEERLGNLAEATLLLFFFAEERQE